MELGQTPEERDKGQETVLAHLLCAGALCIHFRSFDSPVRETVPFLVSFKALKAQRAKGLAQYLIARK